jgi:hypothetical protein
MTKTLNQIIFFFLHQNQNIFFSNIGNQNIFLEKNHNPPFKLNGRSLTTKLTKKTDDFIFLIVKFPLYVTIFQQHLNMKLIHIPDLLFPTRISSTEGPSSPNLFRPYVQPPFGAFPSTILIIT